MTIDEVLDIILDWYIKEPVAIFIDDKLLTIPISKQRFHDMLTDKSDEIMEKYNLCKTYEANRIKHGMFDGSIATYAGDLILRNEHGYKKDGKDDSPKTSKINTMAKKIAGVK